MRVLHIVPRLPPAVCGVGDYSWKVACGLRDWHGVQNTFLVAGTSQQGIPERSEIRVVVAANAGTALYQRLKQEAPLHDAVVVQLSGYGFAKRGAPLALALTLQRFAHSAWRKPVVTMFHELFASGPVTTSAFWLKPWSKLALRMIARLSHGVRTNRQAYAHWLMSQRQDEEPVPAFPVFSNLGEMAEFLPHSQRQDQVLLFQPPDAEQAAAEPFWQLALQMKTLFPSSLWVTAGRTHNLPTGFDSERLGFLSAAEASTFLSHTPVGLLSYYPKHLSKSGLFAAYAAHGIAPLLPVDNQSEADGLKAGTHYLTADLIEGMRYEDAAKCMSEVGQSLYTWYRQHNLRATVQSFYTQIAASTR